MKKLFLTIAVILFFAHGVYPRDIIIGIEDKDDYPQFVGDGAVILKEKPGVIPEVLKLIEKDLGIKIIIKRYPWKRALEVELKNGKIDGILYVSYLKEREKLGIYPKANGKIDLSRRYMDNPYHFYVRKDSNISWNGKLLKNFTGSIGAPAAYSIVTILKNMGYNVEESPTTEKVFERLIVGRIDAAAVLSMYGDVVLKRKKGFKLQIKKTGPPISPNPSFMMFSHKFYKEDPKLANRIWDSLAKIRETKLSSIISKY